MNNLQLTLFQKKYFIVSPFVKDFISESGIFISFSSPYLSKIFPPL